MLLGQLRNLTWSSVRTFRLQSARLLAAKRTHYEVLGVKHNASEEDIHKAFFVKSKQYHPDTNRGDTDEFDRVQQAYTVLQDPWARRDYDRTLKGAKGFDFDVPEYKDEEGGKRSPFIDTTQTFYKHPSFYEDEYLKHEATKVWEYHAKKDNVKRMYEQAKNEPFKDKLTIWIYWFILCFILPCIITWWLYRSVLNQSSKEENFELLKKNMPEGTYFDERTGTFRTTIEPSVPSLPNGLKKELQDD